MVNYGWRSQVPSLGPLTADHLFICILITNTFYTSANVKIASIGAIKMLCLMHLIVLNALVKHFSSVELQVLCK